VHRSKEGVEDLQRYFFAIEVERLRPCCHGGIALAPPPSSFVEVPFLAGHGGIGVAARIFGADIST